MYNEKPLWDENIQYRVKPQKWEPKGGDWYLDGGGCVYDSVSTENTRRYGTDFETKEAAEKAAIAYRRYHRLYKLAEELNEGWEPDWNKSEAKWEIFEVFGRKVSLECRGIIQIATRSLCGVYFKDEDTTKKAIEIIEAGGLE